MTTDNPYTKAQSKSLIDLMFKTSYTRGSGWPGKDVAKIMAMTIIGNASQVYIEHAWRATVVTWVNEHDLQSQILTDRSATQRR